jgi:hypothetical protein
LSVGSAGCETLKPAGTVIVSSVSGVAALLRMVKVIAVFVPTVVVPKSVPSAIAGVVSPSAMVNVFPRTRVPDGASVIAQLMAKLKGLLARTLVEKDTSPA